MQANFSITRDPSAKMQVRILQSPQIETKIMPREEIIKYELEARRLFLYQRLCMEVTDMDIHSLERLCREIHNIEIKIHSFRGGLYDKV